MWPSLTENVPAPRCYPMWAYIACAAALASSCGLVDLREVSVRTEPAVAGAVLEKRETPVRVLFGAEADRSDAEEAFAVLSETGSVGGDIAWDGASFSFVPVDGWKSGVRYRLTLSGTISCADGREARPDIDLTFTAVRPIGAPQLTAAAPADGASVGTRSEEGAMIVLSFSEAMDTRSVQDAFSLEPGADMDFSWGGGDRVLTAIPRDALPACVSYRWKLTSEACAADGAPLASGSSGRFTTDGDHTKPRVVSVRPVVRSGGAWVDTGATLSELGNGQAIAVDFSEPMQADSVVSSIRIEPAFSGRTEVPATITAVFIPDKAPGYGVPLTLVVAADARDLAGLKLGSDYREVFIPAIPPLSVLSVTAGGGETALPPYASATPALGTELAVTITPPDGTLTLAIRFSASFDAPSRAAVIDFIALDAFFPASSLSPELRAVSWPSADTVSLTWEGLERSAAAAPRLYLLSIDGGSGGLSNGNNSESGLVLADDVALLLETEP